MRRLALFLCLLAPARAQSASDVAQHFSQAQRSAHDLSFDLRGPLNIDGQMQLADIQVNRLPAQSLTRFAFRAPEAMSGDIFLQDGQRLTYYLSLSNQISSASSADLSGLEVLTLSGKLSFQLLGSSGPAGQRLFRLRAAPQGGGKLIYWIRERGWQPERIQVYGADNKLLADLQVLSYRQNAGLSAASLRALPSGAQRLP